MNRALDVAVLAVVVLVELGRGARAMARGAVDPAPAGHRVPAGSWAGRLRRPRRPHRRQGPDRPPPGDRDRSSVSTTTDTTTSAPTPPDPGPAPAPGRSSAPAPCSASAPRCGSATAGSRPTRPATSRTPRPARCSRRCRRRRRARRRGARPPRRGAEGVGAAHPAASAPKCSAAVIRRSTGTRRSSPGSSSPSRARPSPRRAARSAASRRSSTTRSQRYRQVGELVAPAGGSSMLVREEPLRRRRRDHPVELPGGDLRPQGRAGADGRQRHRAQAVGGHPAGPDRARPGLRARGRPGRARQRRHRRRPHRRQGARRAPDHRDGHVTGSTRAGREILAQTARQVIPVSLELGGKAPFVVFADADVELAARGRRGPAVELRPGLHLQRADLRPPGVHDAFVERSWS